MYHFDTYDNSLVIDSWEAGVGDSPHTGLSDMRNVNIISVPGEASVNFATALDSPPIITGTITVTGVAANAITFAAVPNLVNGVAIQFTNLGSLTGVALNTTYWVQSSNGTYSGIPTTSIKLFSDYNQRVAVTIGGTAGGATFKVPNVGNNGVTTGRPNYFTYDSLSGASYMQDLIGQVWSNAKVTYDGVTNLHYWTYTGVHDPTGTQNDSNSGNGLAFYVSVDGAGNMVGYVFAFNQYSIDYFNTNNLVWTWGWVPATGAINNNTAYLHSSAGISANGYEPHEAIVAPDNVLYYTDGNWIGSFFQKDPAVAFVPTTPATYVFQQFTALLPVTDVAISLAYLGSKILIGGIGNIIYSFTPGINLSTTGQPLADWIQLAEYNVHRMVTVNTNTFIFAGNRGRIYYTNGTNVQLYKKVPDHISGTVEPYFKWGGACSTKNQLYFSVLVSTNSGTAIAQYGGVWAIDLDTKAIRLTNKLSYGTYAGYAPAIAPNLLSTPQGTGLYIGWDDNSFHYGIDATVGTPYVNSEATIDSDLVPVGTFNHPREGTQIEYKLTKPLVSGESITIQTRLIFDVTSTGYTTTLTDSTVGHFSGTKGINFKNAQWAQFKIILNSTASNPSYTRLKHVRLLGMEGGTVQSVQQLGL